MGVSRIGEWNEKKGRGKIVRIVHGSSNGATMFLVRVIVNILLGRCSFCLYGNVISFL